jgi:peptidyl-prolyl cis-trans isomerase B (cyclophilin B)
VGTEKRERQKANKLQREQEVARQSSRQRSTRIGVIVVGAIVAVFAIVVIAGQFVGDDGDDTDGTNDEGAAAVVVEIAGT